LSLGTNTTRLLVVRDRDDGTVEQIDAAQAGTRLGEGLGDRGTLSAAGAQRTLTALVGFAERARLRGAEPVAIATSAMRRASDAAAFGERVREATGATPVVLSGYDEAVASYVGATYSDAPAAGASVAVLDIGGGSTEFAFGQESTLRDAASLEFGSVRIAERFPDLRGSTAGTPARQAASRARAAVSEALRSIRLEGAVDELRCVAGTPLTLAALAAQTSVEHVGGSVLTRDAVDAVLERLLECDLEERRGLPGMLAQRADILPAGAIILSEAMRALRVSSGRATVDDLLLGYLVMHAPAGRKTALAE